MVASDLRELLGDVAGAPEVLDWDSVEADLGSALPADYREFCVRYPALKVNEHLFLLHPSAVRRVGNLLFRVPRILGHFRERRLGIEGSFPFPIFPEPGGVLPWGFDEDGGFHFWRTIGEADQWTTVVNYRHSSCAHELSFSAFVAGILGGGISCGNVPAGFADRGVSVEAIL